MRVLITNDDGIEAPGLEALARCAVRAGYDVSVVAPRHQMSGTGASMGALALHEPIPVHRWRIPSLDGVSVCAAEATPAACVILSCLGAVASPPDLVLSGINAGLNVGTSALHSGTVGAALAAAAWGAKGLAVSTATGDGEVHWHTAAAAAVDLAAWFMEECEAGCLNVNVPNRTPAALRGVRWATLAPVGAIRSYLAGLTEADDRDGFTVLTDHRRTDPEEAPAGSDRNLVAQGYVTLTGLGGLAEWSPADGSVPALTADSTTSDSMTSESTTPERTR
ncbi:MAG: 5'/3'-nucleotidase SurE [Acidimicrobiia bacterium]|nr:5'/3'-nucleotidase SurE [Acidimicrobiia bacterium]MYE67556.1 5'/3'-nucleotidase SurE [Acidimicrobiia bacterium]MYJ14727.1 5'/3'-nucleotidase SurE [Acidimicrobiia bacterium]